MWTPQTNTPSQHGTVRAPPVWPPTKYPVI